MTVWNHSKTAALTEFITSIMKEFSVPGLSIALTHHGQPLLARGFGQRDVERSLPATEDTIYGIASVTKSFTAMSCLALVKDGKLSLGDPVRRHLPEWDCGDSEANRTMTVHHLLSQTTGLPPSGSRRYCVVRSLDGDPSTDELKTQGKWDNSRDHPPIDTYEQLMEYWARKRPPLLGPCGAQFSYSNDGFALAGAIVERVSELPFATFVEERIMKPAGMTRSFFDPSRLPTMDDVTQLYFKTVDGKVTPAPQWTHAPAMLGSGYIKSTVMDLNRYAQIFLETTPEILLRTLLAKMMAPHVPCGRGTYYGYGLMVHPNHHGHMVVEHGGAQKAVSASFGFVPGTGLAGAVLTNLADVPVQKIWLAAINAALGLPMDAPLAKEPEYSPSNEVEQWAGTYRSEEDVEVTIEVTDSQAFLIQGDKRQPIRQSGPDTGAIERRGSETGIAFVRNSSGKIVGVRFGYRIVPKA